MIASFGKSPFSSHNLMAKSLRRAAQYVRMSTDHQRYSIENQKAAIAEYAICNDIEVVSTYADEGLSGVTIKRRLALQQLISDIQHNQAGFEFVLVYDVSRWGRFQDADESAYYEFICKSAGISVVYCAELFENNGSVLSTLIKVMKRAMAGEYSRELSNRISRAHRHYAKLGFHQGGPPNYGLRRILVDATNQQKIPLQNGEVKSLQNDRVILAIGPKIEVETVREIFRLFSVEHMSRSQIARLLNMRGLRNRRGNLWSKHNIHNMLRNEKYAGTFVYCRTEWPLLGGRICLSPEKWIRVEDAIEPIIDKEMFNAAQKLLKENWAFTDNEMLDYLTAFWCINGYISAPNLNKSHFAPTAVTYRDRFGSLMNAYRLVGYRAIHAYRYGKAGIQVRRIHRQVVCRLTSLGQDDRAIIFDEEKQVLNVDGKLSVAAVALPFLNSPRNLYPGWKLHFDRLEDCEALIAIRMNKANRDILDYHLFPRMIFSTPSIRFTEENIGQFKKFKLRALDDFHRKAKNIYTQKEVSVVGKDISE